MLIQFVKFLKGFIKKEYIPLVVFLLIGISLRFYNINNNFYYDGEIGDNLLGIKDAYIHHYIPLIGPPTSHPWLYFGPLFYWTYGIVLALSKFNPLSYAYFGAFFSTLIIPANYFFMKKIFNYNSAIISTYFITISPLFLLFSYLARFFSIIPLLVYPFLFLLYLSVTTKKRYFFWIGFIFGIMLNLHYTPLILFPFVASIYIIKRIKLSFTNITNFFLGLILPLSPLLYYDARQNFKMVFNLTLWIPYRVLGFLGLYHKNTVSSVVIKENILSFSDFFSSSFLHTKSQAIGYLIAGLLLIFCVYKLLEMRRKHMDFSFVFIFLWGFWGLLAIFIHGVPPLHYFVPVLMFPILVGSLLLADLWKITIGKLCIILGGVLLTASIFSFLFSPQWFYAYKTEQRSYKYDQQTAHTIIADANNKPFSLSRVGANDQFDKNYAQDFIFLLWLYGNEPVNKATLHYTIYDGLKRAPKITSDNQKVFVINKVLTVIRETK